MLDADDLLALLDRPGVPVRPNELIDPRRLHRVREHTLLPQRG